MPKSVPYQSTKEALARHQAKANGLRAMQTHYSRDRAELVSRIEGLQLQIQSLDKRYAEAPKQLEELDRMIAACQRKLRASVLEPKQEAIRKLIAELKSMGVDVNQSV